MSQERWERLAIAFMGGLTGGLLAGALWVLIMCLLGQWG